MKIYKNIGQIGLTSNASWDDIITKLPDQSSVTFAVFTSDYPNLPYPGSGNKRVICITRAYAGYVTIVDWDILNNIRYCRTHNGSNYTQWETA